MLDLDDEFNFDERRHWMKILLTDDEWISLPDEG